jgi:hypothetical protein
MFRKISELLFKILELGVIDCTEVLLVRSIATALILRVNGNLNFTLDQHMLEKLSEHPVMAPLLMNLQ